MRWPLSPAVVLRRQYPLNIFSSVIAPGRLFLPFLRPSQVTSAHAILWSLTLLRGYMLHPTFFHWHPLHTTHQISNTDDFWYSALCAQIRSALPLGFMLVVAAVSVQSYLRSRISFAPIPPHSFPTVISVSCGLNVLRFIRPATLVSP